MIEQLLSKISNILWGPPLLILLFGTHVFLTIRLNFIQLFIGRALKLSFTRRSHVKGDISHFGALMTALAATIGTGNIVGVASAVALGGPGAVLWMWLTGIFGMATKFAEAVLSIKYRVQNSRGEYSGGPMYALEKGMHAKWLGILFACFTAVAAFGIGNMVQANSVAALLNDTFRIPPWTSGMVMALFTALVIIGGVKSISRACVWMVPFMAVSYVGGCLILLFCNVKGIPQTIALIVSSAFTGQAAVGGFLGAGIREAIRYGLARGLFSNEAGLGSAPIVAAAAKTKNPVQQALVSSTGTFWDTV
ncbi:MAG: amino acid carrier protein, partial [Candidatus Omnitrophica bacterium]|nr:amino acid carrier protein [Candidatus Omnitrophota bacterium]